MCLLVVKIEIRFLGSPIEKLRGSNSATRRANKPVTDNMYGTQSLTKVVYLLGAGASHACVSHVGCPHGILMKHLGQPLTEKLRTLLQDGYLDDDSLNNLVNSVIDETTDFEQVITFLGEAPSEIHRRFANEMKSAFEAVLRSQLQRIRTEIKDDPIELYKVLIDLYNIEEFPEKLEGIITINYDEYIEKAIEQVSTCSIDFGFRVQPSNPNTLKLRLLKLHGSFGWQDTWPTARGCDGNSTLWIPPGIQKAKQAYPFNVLWGLAREMLSCNVLRIIGCRLGPNDWDLISLLFTMRHVNYEERPRIEVIDAPSHVEDLKQTYPYLELRSILEVDRIGSKFVAEFTGTSPRRFDELDEEERAEVIRAAGTDRNWFELWLKLLAETLYVELGSVLTTTKTVEAFLES